MHDDEVEVDDELVRRLLAAQMPDLADRPLRKVEPWGTDNAIWRLGDEYVIRLPRIHWAAAQPELEAEWLPRLAPFLPVASCSRPVALANVGFDEPQRDGGSTQPVTTGAATMGAGEAAAKVLVTVMVTLALAFRSFWPGSLTKGERGGR